MEDRRLLSFARDGILLAVAEIERLQALLGESAVRETLLMGERDRLKKENEHLMSLLKAL